MGPKVIPFQRCYVDGVKMTCHPSFSLGFFFFFLLRTPNARHSNVNVIHKLCMFFFFVILYRIRCITYAVLIRVTKLRYNCHAHTWSIDFRTIDQSIAFLIDDFFFFFMKIRIGQECRRHLSSYCICRMCITNLRGFQYQTVLVNLYHGHSERNIESFKFSKKRNESSARFL